MLSDGSRLRPGRVPRRDRDPAPGGRRHRRGHGHREGTRETDDADASGRAVPGRHRLEGRGDRARPAAGRGGAGAGGRRRAVPLRGAPPGRRHPVRRADDRRARGRRVRRGRRAGGHAGQAGRLHRLLLDPQLRAVPVLRARPAEPVRRRGRDHDRQADLRRRLPAPEPGRAGSHHHLPGRLLRPAHRRQRGVGHRRRPVIAARGGLPHRLRRAHRLGLVGLRGRRPPGRRGRGGRRRRPRLGRGAGRAAVRGAAHLRDRPGRVQALLGAGVRRDARRRPTWRPRSI